MLRRCREKEGKKRAREGGRQGEQSEPARKQRRQSVAVEEGEAGETRADAEADADVDADVEQQRRQRQDESESVVEQVQLVPEWRLRATLLCMPLVPLSFIAYAWLVEFHTPIPYPVISLFFAGFSSIWVYSATLSYIIDSSVGMASSAVSLNALFRGVAAFAASEVAQPLLDTVGNGVLYSIWTGLLIAALLTVGGICWRGKEWRERAERRRRRRRRSDEGQER